MRTVSRMFLGILFLLAMTGAVSARHSQAQTVPTASQTGDLLVGAGYARVAPDYSPANFNGLTVFGDFDFAKYFGVEAELDRSSKAVPVTLTETTFGIGGRVRVPVYVFQPYIKIMVGTGTFSAGNSPQNGTYSMYAGGGGVEYRLPRKLFVRADYEYQRWGSFPPHGLQPSVGSFSVGYRLR